MAVMQTKGTKLLSSEGEATVQDEHLLCYSHSTYPGMSGSPIFIKGDELTLAGIHLGCQEQQENNIGLACSVGMKKFIEIMTTLSLKSIEIKALTRQTSLLEEIRSITEESHKENEATSV